MPQHIDDIIQTVGSKDSDHLVSAASELAETLISLKQQEHKFPQILRPMIRELFRLQIELRAVVEEFDLALSPEKKLQKETELRESLGIAATAFKDFEDRAQQRGVGRGAIEVSTPAWKQGASVDVGILTVIPPELAAAKKVLGLGDNTRYVTEAGAIYRLATRQLTEEGPRTSVSLGFIGDAGNYNAAAAAVGMIRAVRPKFMVLVGIAAGLRGKVRIGDVVLSERVVGYESGAIEVQSGNGGMSFRPRPELTRPSPKVRQFLGDYLAGDPSARVAGIFGGAGFQVPKPPSHVVQPEWEENVSRSLKIQISTIASGEKLLRNPEKLLALREVHGKIEVGEMESSGFSEACEKEGVEWIVIRGISDFGDAFKDDRFHTFASETAAAVARDFIGQLRCSPTWRAL